MPDWPTEMAKLDRSRDFGEVSGAASDGARYYQDGKAFNACGDEIGAPAPKVKAKAASKPTPLDSADQLAAQMGTSA